jgi:symplekin
MASKDPLQALTAALSVPADSKEQADLLAALRETLEAQPHPIPILCQTLLKTAASSNDSLLRRWVLELLHFGIARAPLSVDARTNRPSLPLVPFFSFSFSSIPTISLGRRLRRDSCTFFAAFVSDPFVIIVAVQSLDVLVGLLNDDSPWTVKVAVQSIAGAYPLLFRRL